MEPGQELLTSWPSYPLFPIMARRAHGRAVPVGGGEDAAGGRAAGGRPRAQHARGGARQPQRPDRRAARGRGAGAAAGGPAGGGRGAAGRGARRLRRRPADRRVARAAGGVPAPAGVPQLLQGVGPGGAARSATRWGAPARRSCSRSWSPTSGSASSRRRGRWRRCAPAPKLLDAPRAARLRWSASAAHRRPARARLRGRPTARPTSCGSPTPPSTAGELATRLERAGVLVAAGDALGEPRHVRIACATPPPRTVC